MRRHGLGAIKSKTAARTRYTAKGAELAEANFTQLKSQFETFREKLEKFAHDHRHEIKNDSNFRTKFQQMCAQSGVDPLASSKGFWAETLQIGDFYYELAVQVVEVLMATSHRNGGLMTVSDLRRRIVATGGKAKKNLSDDDVLIAVRKLAVFGNGFTVHELKDTHDYLVQSIPGEFSMDHTSCVQLAQSKGYFSADSLHHELKWTPERIDTVINSLITQGLVWIDEQSRPVSYWFPTLFGEAESDD